MNATLNRPDSNYAGKVKDIIVKSLRRLISEDEVLLKLDVNEPAICARLAMYIQCELNSSDGLMHLDVDCEYNRMENGDSACDQIKKILCMPKSYVESDDLKNRLVYPDVIIHNRSNTPTKKNLAVIEVKKATNTDTCKHDLFKLREYKKQIGYTAGYFIVLNTGFHFLEERAFHVSEIDELTKSDEKAAPHKFSRQFMTKFL